MRIEIKAAKPEGHWIDISSADNEHRAALLSSGSGLFKANSCYCTKNIPSESGGIDGMCGACGTRIDGAGVDRNKPLLWASAPAGIPWINPDVLSRVRECTSVLIGRKRTSIMDYILGITANKPVPEILSYLESNGVTRGYVNFIGNLKQNLLTVLRLPLFSTRIKASTLANVIELTPDEELQTMTLPLLPGVLLIYDQTSFGQYLSPGYSELLGFTSELWGIHNDELDDTSLEIIQAKALLRYTKGIDEVISAWFTGKSAEVKASVFSAKALANARTVLTHLRGVHDFDQVEVPWLLMVVMSTPYLLHHVTKFHPDGLNYQEAYNYVNQHATAFDSLLYEGICSLQQHYLNEGYKGVPIFLQRFPSNTEASGNTLYLRLRKEWADGNIGDKTIAMSTVLMPQYSADIDGDEVSIAIVQLSKSRLRKWCDATRPDAYAIRPSTSSKLSINGMLKPQVSHIVNVNLWARNPIFNEDIEATLEAVAGVDI